MTAARPLRIALIAPYDLSRPGGVNNQIRAQARALRRRGHTVQIYGPTSGSLSDDERSLGRCLSVTLGGTESGLGLDPAGLPAVGRLLREPFDLLHVHEPLTPLMPWMVVWRARAPVVGTFHVHRESGHRLYAASAWALAPVIRRLHTRIAVSDAARRTVASHFAGEYEIIPNGIDIDAFRAPQPRPGTMTADRTYVLYAGRLEPRKGVEHLIHAMIEVSRRVPHATLIVAGDGPERGRLQQLAAAAGDAIQFVGRVPDDELRAYFQSTDIVCSPATGGESFGIVLLEGMACGKPILASRIEGYEALVSGADCASLFPAGDTASLVRELLFLLDNRARRHALGARGAVLAQQYDWQAIAGRLEHVYERALSA